MVQKNKIYTKAQVTQQLKKARRKGKTSKKEQEGKTESEEEKAKQTVLSASPSLN